MNKKFSKSHLHECLRSEVMRNNETFSWFQTIRKAYKYNGRRFNFWWRIASHLYNNKGVLNKKIAKHINIKLMRKYCIDIGLGAEISKGLKINHGFGIVIRDECVIGENFTIRQNTTIGKKYNGKSVGYVSIGNNVDIGANTCIIGDIKIGNNVTIGAASFINKNIPDNLTAYNKRETQFVTKTKLNY